VGRVEKVLAVEQEIQLALPKNHPEALADVQAQMDRLLPQGFVTTIGTARLADVARYLTATRRRLEQLPNAPVADRDRMARVHAVRDAYDELLRALPAARQTSPDVLDIGWQIEEFRVSLWAQQLGTPRPVSEQRIYRAIDDAAEHG
jgi:ATP-dependent helicase HrpA